jgi:cell division protease FtsH
MGRALGKALDWWYPRQRWWWVGIVVVIVATTAYDLGGTVTRAEMLPGARAMSGAMTLDEVVQRSKEHPGGRLLIISPQAARYIDPAGQSWSVPNFSREANQGDMEALKDARVMVDGEFSQNIRPVKTTADELLLAEAAVLAFRIVVVAVYLALFWMLISFLSSRAGHHRFRLFKAGESGSGVKIADVAGYDGVKNELLEVVDYLRDPDRFSRVGARPPRGILLYGPPGTGKTLMAKAVAGEAQAAFLEQSASSFVQVYAGEGAKAVRQLFAKARSMAPAVIFIDEIDAVGGQRGGGHEERVQTLNGLLTEMDGFADNSGIVVVAATNRLDSLDEALMRPGRFDRKVWIGLPAPADREKILRVHAKRLPHVNVDWSRWATQTQGFAGAELAALVNEAAIEAARDGAVEVNDFHVQAARDRVMVGARNHGQILSAKEKHIVAVHELGHAWMRLAHGKQVEKVSIAPRGMSLGITVSMGDDEEQYLMSRTDLDRELAFLMGGRAAEEALLGEVTGGAADDMSRASKMARDALMRLGAGQFGPYLPSGRDAEGQLDQLAADAVNQAYQRAVAHIGRHKDLILGTALVLETHEEISGPDLVQAWQGHPAKDISQA